MATASVVIRAKDEAGAIARTLDALAAQTAPHEVIVVDSGSRDRTREIARERGAQLIELAPETFSYGGALNAGATAASAPVIVSLSAHALPRSTGWLDRLVAHFADERVACVYGERYSERYAPLTELVRQDATMLARNPYWGYSNSAGGFRAALWRERPFREDMPGTEDREWSMWALAQGNVCVLDPELAVVHDHTRDSLRECFRRYAREHRGFTMFLELPRYRARDVLIEWWSDRGGHRSHARARLDPRRMARLAGKWWGRRA